ncbi:hypothetical protein MBLNU459_g3693t1 [Dothideomycetes sp. NU459]
MPAQQSWWGKVGSGSKVGFDRLYGLVDKLGAPVNKLSNKLGSEAFWPTTLDKESDKAARILRSFCKDGFYEDEKTKTADGPTARQRVLKKIPPEVIRNAKGLAIFTTMRSGLWISGAGGSGVLVGRTADGSWSPPSGIMLHTAGLGFLVGIDIYDCVVVINSQKALDAFSKIRCTLGGEISAVAGPVGAGGVLETEVHKRQAPVFTYLKSRGFYAGVQIDGTIIIERTDENERFYNQKVPVADILAGKVRHPPYETRVLLETIKAAQGDMDVDQSMLTSEPPPGDYEIEDETHIFGVPDKEDPDPYGVLALEKEGMSIREAGTLKRASWEQFSFQPAPTSPLYSTFGRKSVDRDSNRTAVASRPASMRSSSHHLNGDSTSVVSTSVEQKQSRPKASMTSMSTQTDFPEPPSPGRSSVRSSLVGLRRQTSMDDIPENGVALPSPPPRLSRKSSSRSRRSPPRSNSRSTSPQTESPKEESFKKAQPATIEESPKPVQHGAFESSSDADREETAGETADETADEEDEVDEVIIEEPVMQTVRKASAAAPQFISRARVVEVPKRIPPKLPARSARRTGPLVINADSDVGAGSSEPTSATSPALSPVPSLKSQPDSPLQTRPDWAPPAKKDHLGDELGERFANVDLSPGEPSPGEERNPWGTIMAKHTGSQDSMDVPGAFHSLPPTPGEHKEEQPAMF